MQRQTLTVRQLNLYVRSLLESDPRLCDVLVSGEISNFKNHYASGHLYFTLKDKDAAIRCVMFRSYAAKIRFIPEDGMAVILRGKVSVYEKDGTYQLYVEDMRPDGIGDIALAFEQIKERLQKEGLFDANTKRTLPKFPSRIAIVTSDTGAAVRDITNILSRRWPIAERVLYPVAVQGDMAVPDMIRALESIYETDGTDLIIIGRGGGSIEDLWAFNSEILARKIYESPIPVISAVGHETDFTICDFVADLRAPTPSAAAELAVPDIMEIENRISNYNTLLKKFSENKVLNLETRLGVCLDSLSFKKPQEFITAKKFERLDRVTEQLINRCDAVFLSAESRFSNASGKLDALSPLKVLSRGYAAVRNENSTVSSVKDLNEGDMLNLRFSDGSALCEIKNINKKLKE